MGSLSSPFKLALEIGATVGQSFGAAIKGSQKQLGQLGASLDKLKSQQAGIKKVELAEEGVGKARVAYNTASKPYCSYANRLPRQTSPASN